MTYDHWNSADILPPVGCPIVVMRADGRPKKAERVAHISKKDRLMEYRMEDGEVVLGRLPWTYP